MVELMFEINNKADALTIMELFGMNGYKSRIKSIKSFPIKYYLCVSGKIDEGA